MDKIGLRALTIAGGLAGALVAGPALADTTFILGNGNAAIGGFPGPFGTVTVHLVDSTDALITFTNPDPIVGGNEYLFGDGSTADVNVNTVTAPSWTIGSFTASNDGTGFTPGPVTDAGSKNVNGFGVFNQTTASPDGYGNSSDTVSFVLTDTGGTWANSDSVLTGNADGFSVAAHIFICAAPTGECDAGSSALVTGFAANGAVSTVPEPSTWAMMALGFIGLAFAAFHRSHRENVSIVG